MGKIFSVPAMAIFAIAGIWGFIVSLMVIFENFGIIGVAVSFFLGPVTIAIVPWYEGFANANWQLVIITYGGGILAMILSSIGSYIDDRQAVKSLQN